MPARAACATTVAARSSVLEQFSERLVGYLFYLLLSLASLSEFCPVRKCPWSVARQVIVSSIEHRINLCSPPPTRTSWIMCALALHLTKDHMSLDLPRGCREMPTYPHEQIVLN